MQAVCMISGQYPLAVDRLFGSLGDLGYGWGGGGGGVCVALMQFTFIFDFLRSLS